MNRKLFWRTVLIAYAGAIFYLSSLPLTNGGPLLPIPGGDKILHCGEFFLFGLLAAAGSFGKRPILAAFVLTAVYAGSDELHQLFVPARDASIADWGADIAGGIIAAGTAFLFLRRTLSGVHRRFILNGRKSDKGE
jgi:hypothetical protein